MLNLRTARAHPPANRRPQRYEMKITREEKTELTIRRVESGAITIGDETLTRSVALTVDRIIREWPERRIRDLTIADLDPLLADEPEMIVLGTGDSQRFPRNELLFALARRGIGLETMDTRAACRTFNILVAEGRRPAAVLFIEHEG